MNNTKRTALLIVIVAVAAVSVIAAVWSIYIFDHFASDTKASAQTTLSTSSLETETTEETTATETEQTTASSDMQTEETTTAKPDKPEKPKKMIALTFDDGPSAQYTHKILDLLEEYDAKATFFVLGNMLGTGSADEVQRAISLGCEIGNHSYSHPYLTKISEEEIVREIASTNEKISAISGTNYECKVYRPPNGDLSRRVMDVLYENGIYMYPIFWSSDSRDWEYRSKYSKGQITREEAVQGTFNTIVRETSEGTVILMHDIQEITPDVVKLVLEKYTAEGYSFVTVSELFDFENNQDPNAYFYRYRSTKSIVPVS